MSVLNVRDMIISIAGIKGSTSGPMSTEASRRIGENGPWIIHTLKPAYKFFGRHPLNVPTRTVDEE